MARVRWIGAGVLLVCSIAAGSTACSATSSDSSNAGSGGTGGAAGSGGIGGTGGSIGTCGAGVTNVCVGNEVHACKDGQPGDLIEACDTLGGYVCSNGMCRNGCDAAADEQSNVGCDFWAVDLDLSDGITDPASFAWGVVVSNAGSIPADVTIERNDQPVGSPAQPVLVTQVTLQPDNLQRIELPTREIDCGAKPNDWNAPGTCLTSAAYRIRSTAPIVVYQFNNLVHGWSTDASLLLPTAAIGSLYRVTGWGAGKPVLLPGAYVQRAYITVVGNEPGTKVTVIPTYAIKGNGPIPDTPAGGVIEIEIGPYDVLNLESADGDFNACLADQVPPYCSDLTGSIVKSTKPVAVFSGTESSGVVPPDGAPKPPTYDEQSGGCCLQHLEEQLAPLTAIGKKFVVTRSPVRSTLSNYEEPDVIRFVGMAAPSQVKTNLPAPFDAFEVLPGEVKQTWTQTDFVVEASEPIVVAQYLVAQGWVNGNPKGDPSFTIFPPVEQQRTEYLFLSPEGWSENYVVIAAESSTVVSVDGAVPPDCVIASAGTLEGKAYEARRCMIAPGAHRLSGNGPFGIMAYGYGDADTYSFPGGAFVKKIYEPPPVR